MKPFVSKKLNDIHGTVKDESCPNCGRPWSELKRAFDSSMCQDCLDKDYDYQEFQRKHLIGRIAWARHALGDAYFFDLVAELRNAAKDAGADTSDFDSAIDL